MSGSALWGGMRGVGWRKCVAFISRPCGWSFLVFYGGLDGTHSSVYTQTQRAAVAC